MKTVFKTFAAALAIAATVSACDGNKSADSADSSKVDSSTTVKTTTDTTIHADTAATRDTGMLASDSASTAQGARVDTLKKTVTKTTVVKKQVTKKP